MRRNIFIRDISSGGKSTNYWKYIVNGIEYYVPNYGYLVLIDSNFRDFDEKLMEKNYLDTDRTRKLDGKFINNDMSESEIYEKTFNMMKNVLNPNLFDDDFIKEGGTKPPDEILTLLSSMNRDFISNTSNDISYYISKYMKQYMNNRIGTLLNDNEIKNVNKGGVKEINRGQIVSMKNEDGVEIFVLHIETKDNISRIITRDSLDINNYNLIEKDVPYTSLNIYSVTKRIHQSFNPRTSNLSEENLIETYSI